MKSEKEKMLAGKLYDASDKVLKSERNRAKELTFEFNHIKPSEELKK